MKRSVLALVLIILAAFSVHGQDSQEQEGSGQNVPMDIILLLDTSTNMSSSYDNVMNYITGGFLTEFLRIGDTFHLIAFSETPRLDVARRIAASGDVDTINARMMIQYPIERGSNISGAITYAERYISGLPARPKKIVIVSTGGQGTQDLVSSANSRLSSRNTTIHFVQVTPGQPISDTPRSGRTGSGGQQGTGGSAALGSGTTGTRDQGYSGEADSGSGTRTGSGAGSDDWDSGTQDQRTETGEHTAGSQDLSSGTSDTESGTSADSSVTGSTVSSAGTSTASSSDSGSGFSFASSWPWIVGGILLLLLIIGLIMLLASRRLGSSPNRVMAQVASSKDERVDHSKDLARYAASAGTYRRETPYSNRSPAAGTPVVINPHGPLLLNLFVEDQNTMIGKRNIHSLKSGYSLSVGGGKGDGFLIFLVPIPGNIGELRRNGSQLTFIPKKAKYFPDIGSNEVRDCLNKTIRIISDKNYELRFRFEMYEDPLIALNRMLNSIKVPG